MTKFKVGDKVRSLQHLNDCIPIGYEDTILGIDEFSCIRLTKRFGWWNHTNFELVEEKSKFKVGDKVRCVDSSTSGGSLTQGRVYIFERDDGPGIRLQGSSGIWDASRFKLVESAPANPSPVRKVTRTEIVPGTYGDVKVFYDNPGIFIEYSTYSNPVNLRNAAHIFNEIADALEQNKESHSPASATKGE